MRRNSKGFTLLEMMVVCVIIAMLASIILPVVSKRIDFAKMTVTMGDIDSLETAIGLYKNDTGDYSESYNSDPDGDGDDDWTIENLSGIVLLEWRLTGRVPFDNFNIGGIDYNKGDIDLNITRDSSWMGPYIKSLTTDAWNNEYIYLQNRFPQDECPNIDPLICRQIVDPAHPLEGDYPVDGDGSCIAPARNLDYYLYSKGRDRKTSSDGDAEKYENPIGTTRYSHSDDINNWDTYKNWMKYY